jgi:hypothetical protein
MGMYGKLRSLSESRLDGFIENPDQLMDFFLSDDESEVAGSEEYDLDKRWHVIHFLLNGNVWEGTPPAFNVILGGTEIGEDTGFGPPRYLRPGEVKEVAEYLKSVSADQLLSRFDADALNANEIYSGHWNDDPEEREVIRDCYLGLVKYYEQAARERRAMILLIG